MGFDVVDGLGYTESHEWADDRGDAVRVGITDFAQDELGDIVFVDLPEEGEQLAAGDAFGVIESIKAVSDLYAPVSGTVVATNDDLHDQPELVNEEPFEGGWMIAVETDADVGELLDAADYQDQI